MSDKNQTRRWLCRNDHIYGSIVEIISDKAPMIDGCGYWVSGHESIVATFTDDAEEYGNLTGIYLDRGDGPIELVVTRKSEGG